MFINRYCSLIDVANIGPTSYDTKPKVLNILKYIKVFIELQSNGFLKLSKIAGGIFIVSVCST